MEKTLFHMERLISAQIGGLVGKRLQANLDRWICDVPDANPALFQSLRSRDFVNLGVAHTGAHEYIGKYLVSAAYCLRLSDHPRLRAVIAQTVRTLACLQSPEGYLGGMPKGDWFVRDHVREEEKKYTWDLWGHYHVMHGLLMVYRTTGDPLALDVTLKAAELILRFFSDKPLSDVRCGFTNLAIGHVFALLYEQTGEKKYLDFAQRVVEAFHDPQSEAGDYLEGILAGKEFFELSNTRWEGLHAVETLAILWRITGNQRYREGVERIWRSIVKTDRHNTGGFTSDERAVGNPYDLRGIETCCTVAWLALSTHMLTITSDSTVADEIELSTFNGIFAAQHPSGRHSTYNTPMIGDKKASIHEIVFQAVAGAPETNCCSVNIGRALAGMAEWGFIPKREGLYINYYGESNVRIRMLDDAVVTLTQQTQYPVDGQILLTVEGLTHGSLYLRIPCWSEKTYVTVNDTAIRNVKAGTYLPVPAVEGGRLVIRLSLDMSFHCWIGDQVVKGKSSWYYGPLLLAYDYRFNGQIQRPFQPIDVAGTPTPTFSPPICFTFSDAPTISEHTTSWERVACDQKGPIPWLIFRVKDTNGMDVYLCDFVSAGQTGTPYTTWLPMEHPLSPLPMEQAEAWRLWCVRSSQ